MADFSLYLGTSFDIIYYILPPYCFDGGFRIELPAKSVPRAGSGFSAGPAAAVAGGTLVSDDTRAQPRSGSLRAG